MGHTEAQAQRLDSCVHGFIMITCRQCAANQETLIEASIIRATVGCRDITWAQQKTLGRAARVLAGRDA